MSAGKTPQPAAAAFSVPQEARERFSLARTSIQLYWPFLTSASYRLVPRWTPLVPTLAVDRYWRLYLNPDFVLENDPPTLALLIAGHELQHALMGHADRLAEHRDKVIIWNGQEICMASACHDLAINSGLRKFAASGLKYRTEVTGKAGILEAPGDALYPEFFRDKNGNQFPNGLVSEGYAELFVNHCSKAAAFAGSVAGKGRGKGSGNPGKAAANGQCGSGGGSTPQPWEDPGGADPDKPDSGVSPEEQAVLKQHTAQAAIEQAKKHRGTVPGELEAWAELQLEPPKVDWRKELKSAVRKGYNWAAGRTDYSFSRPNRRTIATMSRVVLPGMFSPEPRLAVVFDTSGSMGPQDFDIVFSEIKGILAACGMKKVPVLACDARCYGVQMVSSIEELAIIGRDGTDMDAGIAGALEVPGINLIICCTDGVCPWTPEPPPDNVRVIIVLTQEESDAYPTPSWARVVAAYDT